MDLFAARHAQAIPNVPDPGITSLGEAQAKALAEWITHNLEPDLVLYSTMRRAEETALCMEGALYVPF